MSHKGPAPQRRFEFAPLQRRHAPFTVAGMARTVGISRVLLQKAKRDGLTETLADRVAIGLGDHPSLIWPDWFADLTDTADLVEVPS